MSIRKRYYLVAVGPVHAVKRKEKINYNSIGWTCF